jgi:hypothetical protein
MGSRIICWLFLFAFWAPSCKKKETIPDMPKVEAYRETRTIEHNGVEVQIVIDMPALQSVDILLLYHGTVALDSKILEAANNTLDVFKRITKRQNIAYISVAYPEENLKIGDNLLHAEAALLWLKEKGSNELNRSIHKIFLAGHSQGGYLVSRLNTMHPTDGVIANAPGPLNLVYRCELEENGQIPKGIACNLLLNSYGTTSQNPDAYFARSLLNFTENFKSKVLYIQGLNDSYIQMTSWPIFKQKVQDCTNCEAAYFLELERLGHSALFESPYAQIIYNDFIDTP